MYKDSAKKEKACGSIATATHKQVFLSSSSQAPTIVLGVNAFMFFCSDL